MTHDSLPPSQELEQLKEENDLLLHQLDQVQQELEHYYLLSTRNGSQPQPPWPISRQTLSSAIEDERRARKRAEKTRDAILQSTSWRMTAPLRWLQVTLTNAHVKQHTSPPGDYLSVEDERKARIRAEKYVNDLLTSTSWKLSAPIRWRRWPRSGVNQESMRLRDALEKAREQCSTLEQRLATATAERDTVKRSMSAVRAECETLKRSMSAERAECDSLRQQLAIANANRDAKDAVVSELCNDQQRGLRNLGYQLENFIRLQCYLGADFLIPDLHAWPISPDLAVMLIRLMRRHRYDGVIEFGSGVSTSIIAKVLANTDQRPRANPTPFLSLEHLDTYFDDTAAILDDVNLRSRVTLLLAPLEEYIGPDATHYMYYGCADALRDFRNQVPRFSPKLLVLVDGPPAATGAHARFPALPYLLQAFDPQDSPRTDETAPCLDIVVDDYNRPDERAMVAEWEGMLADRHIPCEREVFSQLEKKACLLRVGKSPS